MPKRLSRSATQSATPMRPRTPKDPIPRTVWSQGIDSDVDLRIPDERAELGHTLRTIGVVALGGVIGASGRYTLSQAWPTPAGGLPWSTFTINVTGCLALGALMSILGNREQLHPLVRPFLGTGLIGGYTTYSTYAVETNTLLQHHHPILGLAYLWFSMVAGVVAVFAGHTLTDQLARTRSSVGRP